VLESGLGHLDHQLPVTITDAGTGRHGLGRLDPGPEARQVIPVLLRLPVDRGPRDEEVAGELGGGELPAPGVLEDQQPFAACEARPALRAGEPGGQDAQVSLDAIEVEADFAGPDAASLSGAQGPHLAQ